MKRLVLIYGSIIGAVLCVNMIFMVSSMYADSEFKGNDILGYTLMIGLFALIYFAISRYKTQTLGGYINFGKAFKLGSLIVLLASTIYVVVWLFYYYLFVPDFMDVYADHVLRNCTDTDLATKTAEMDQMKVMYSNPALVVLITYAEVLPLGILVSFISALVLKKKPVEIA